MNEVYQSPKSPTSASDAGFHYSFVQGGWPLGFLLASALASPSFPPLAGAPCTCGHASRPLIIVVVIAKQAEGDAPVRAAPQADATQEGRQDRRGPALARAYGVEHCVRRPRRSDLGPHLRRNTIVLSLAWIVNFFGITIFSVLGSSVLKNAKGVKLRDAFWMLIVINLLAYFGYVFHGWLGDKIGRKRTIIGRLDRLRHFVRDHAEPDRRAAPFMIIATLRRRTVLPGRAVRRDPVLHGRVLPGQLPCHRYAPSSAR